MAGNANLASGGAPLSPGDRSDWKATLKSLNETLVSMEETLAFLFLFLMVLGSFAMWCLRVFWGASVMWVGEVTSYAMLWSGFLGASIATSNLQHFRIDLVRFISNPALKKTFRTLSYLAAFVFFGVFSYAAIRYMQTLFLFKERSRYLDWPLWPFYLVIVYFYAMGMLRFFLTAIMKVR